PTGSRLYRRLVTGACADLTILCRLALDVPQPEMMVGLPGFTWWQALFFHSGQSSSLGAAFF
ncbi:MAG TPA: hypothetical protein VNZ22_19325, partial [Bacillota bacterium]|nr:hypothetical protein [Bacillota bacterium]